MTWRDVNWVEFCRWVSSKRVVSAVDSGDGGVHIVFEGGAEAAVSSEYDGPYSDVTPGNGIEAPTVRIKEAPQGT